MRKKNILFIILVAVIIIAIIIVVAKGKREESSQKENEYIAPMMEREGEKIENKLAEAGFEFENTGYKSNSTLGVSGKIYKLTLEEQTGEIDIYKLDRDIMRKIDKMSSNQEITIDGEKILIYQDVIIRLSDNEKINDILRSWNL